MFEVLWRVVAVFGNNRIARVPPPPGYFEELRRILDTINLSTQVLGKLLKFNKGPPLPGVEGALVFGQRNYTRKSLIQVN
jgi:hypothetical protein